MVWGNDGAKAYWVLLDCEYCAIDALITRNNVLALAMRDLTR